MFYCVFIYEIEFFGGELDLSLIYVWTCINKFFDAFFKNFDIHQQEYKRNVLVLFTNYITFITCFYVYLLLNPPFRHIV